MTDEDEATYDDYCYSCACHHDNPSDGSWDCESEDNEGETEGETK